MRQPSPGQATIEDYLRCDPERRLELIRGVLVEKAAPSGEHSHAQVRLGRQISWFFDRKPGGRSPGGWWILSEVDVRLGAEVVRPDVCGYRRDRMPKPPSGRLIDLPPDWVCEILSPSNEDRDRVEKLETYFRSGVPHYWILNPVAGTLEVFRRTELAYALVLPAHRGQKVRAEPFDAVELSVDELLGGDPEEDET